MVTDIDAILGKEEETIAEKDAMIEDEGLMAAQTEGENPVEVDLTATVSTAMALVTLLTSALNLEEKEEISEETTEEMTEEMIEETIDETNEEMTEGTIEETIDETTEETIEETIDEMIEEMIEEKTAEITEEILVHDEMNAARELEARLIRHYPMND